MSRTQSIALGNANEFPASVPAAAQSLLRSYMELGKARLSLMVVVTAAVGYFVASQTMEHTNWTRLWWTCLGTFLAAVGASAFNQAIEAPRDARMPRTFKRPIPAGHISRTHAAFVGLIASIIGVAILCPTSNGLAALLCTVNLLLYVLVYTPMKPYTTANTLVGAIVGAIPPMLGWAAAVDRLDAGAWLLGAVLFAWQIPHFLALAWMYRADYAKGGYKMLPVVEPSGRLTCLLAMLYSLVLLPLCVMLVVTGAAGWFFLAGSMMLGLGFFALTLKLAMDKTHANARKLFLGSVLYLPLLMAILVIDARGPLDGLQKAPAGYVAPSNDGSFQDPSLGSR